AAGPEPALTRDLHLRRMKCIGKRKGDQHSLSHVPHQRGAKAGNAGAAGVANAGIDNSGRSSIEQAPRELLRGAIAVGIQVLLVSGVPALIFAARIFTAPTTTAQILVPQIMKLGAKVGQVLTVGNRLFFLPIHLAQSLSIVEG